MSSTTALAKRRCSNAHATIEHSCKRCAKGSTTTPARLLAYCAMPNHWHLVMGPIDPKPLSKLMHWVTVTHAVRWHRHHHTTGLGPVYQGRYSYIHSTA
jgi:REP element-mobilizing transposase RayT